MKSLITTYGVCDGILKSQMLSLFSKYLNRYFKIILKSGFWLHYKNKQN